MLRKAAFWMWQSCWLRNSQQLWLPVQELHRVRPSTISSEMRELDALIPSEEPLAVDGCWQQGCHFSSAV